MIKINPPTFDLKEVLDFCFASDNRKDSKNIYIPKLRPIIEMFGQFYEDNALNNKFHEIQFAFIIVNLCLSDNDLNFLNKLYEYRFRGDKFGKYYYNFIIKNISNFCPYCNHGYIREVDHFIPQAAYSIFNIHPKNLVPICVSCNKDKDDNIGFDEKTNLLHPYYDDLNHTQWLFAEIIPKQGICKYEVVYRCIPDSNIYDAIQVERLKNNFDKMKFSNRFESIAISKSRDITDKISQILEFKTDRGRRNFLHRLVSRNKIKYGENHWLVALYQGFLNYSGSLDDFR